MAEEVQLRFRHAGGDIGPQTFADTTSIQHIKDKLVAEWPTEGPLAKETPTQAADLKLILSGKYVENSKTLRDYKKEMGEIKPETVVTLHMVIRPGTSAKKDGTTGNAVKQDDTPKGCACIIA